MMQEQPLIGEGRINNDDDTVFASTYIAPIIPEKRIVTSLKDLSNDPKEREIALQRWADDLAKW